MALWLAAALCVSAADVPAGAASTGPASGAAAPAASLVKPVNAPPAAPAGDPGQTYATAAPAHTPSAMTNPVSTNLASSNAPPAASTMETLDDVYHLAIGDRLSFRIVEDEEDPRALVVADSGELEVPYIGRFKAGNKTCKQLARELKAEVEKEYYYQATIILAVDNMTRSRGKVYLVGPVRMPGPMDIPSDEVLTLTKAIMRAGGFASYADQHHVKITRKAGTGAKDNRVIIVDVTQVLQKGETDRDIPLEPDDLVVVPERLIRF